MYCQALQQQVQAAGSLTGSHQAAIKRREVRRMSPQSNTQGSAGFYICANVCQQSGKSWIALAATERVKALQQRHPRLQHGRQLPGE